MEHRAGRGEGEAAGHSAANSTAWPPSWAAAKPGGGHARDECGMRAGAPVNPWSAANFLISLFVPGSWNAN